MLFSNSSIIVYLKRSSLEVYSQKSEGVQARLDFPPNYQKDQEILDVEKFEQLIANFLSKLNLKDKKIIIAISADNLFEKTIPLSDKAKEDAAANKFFEEIPFDPQKIVKKQIRTKNGLNLIAANKNLFESIVHVLQKLESEVHAVVPVTMFGISSLALTRADEKKITSNSELLKTSNLLSAEPTIEQSRKTEQTDENSQKKSKFSPVVILGIGFIIIGIAVAAFLLFKQGKISKIIPINNKPSETSSPSPKQSAPLPQIDVENLDASRQAQISPKNNIKIQILNGSGIAGQASQVQIALESLSFSQIEVGNAPSQDITATKIEYAKGTAQTYVDEIKLELEKTFTSVETAESPEIQDFDIIIITGKSS